MLILNIQYFEGDKVQAMALARLIADLEPVPRGDVTVLFTARFDTEHDYATEQYVAGKFPVESFTCKRKATGWPNGPNQMMGESYCYIVEEKRRGKFQGCEVVHFVEADCVPLTRDWINRLLDEWGVAKRYGKKVMGAWLKFGDANCEHINGNCWISLDFWRRCRDIFNPPSRGGWDAALKRAILPVGHPSRLIWSDYQLGMPHNPWKGCDYLWAPKRYSALDNVYYGEDLQPVYFHGLKTMDGINCVRQKLLN